MIIKINISCIPTKHDKLTDCLFSLSEECSSISGEWMRLRLGEMAKNVITIKIFRSGNIDKYHDKDQIIISFKYASLSKAGFCS